MPNTAPDQPTGDQSRRDAYDKANTIILALTLIAAGCAATFTGWQAWIARDQEHSVLRAYVVLDAELVAQSGTGQQVIRFKIENMGQTPVYDLGFDLEMSVIPLLYRGPPATRTMTVKCDDPRPFAISTAGETFSRISSYETASLWGLPDTDTVASLFDGNTKPTVYGTACYRDIFNRWHAIRMCYQWVNTDQRPYKCIEEAGADTPP